MKDIKHVVIFTAIGLGIAYVASGPLRHPPANAPLVGTPMRPQAPAAESTQGDLYAKGSIELSPAIPAERSVTRMLFIIARPAAGGPPVAVKKVGRTTLPIDFSLTTEDNMVGEEFFSGDLTIIARLDADGMAGPKQGDDWEGTASANASDRTVHIVIAPSPQ